MKKLNYQTHLKETVALVATQANLTEGQATEEVEIYLQAYYPSPEELAHPSNLATAVVGFYLKAKIYIDTRPQRL
jgi:hypothetical protein